MSIMNFGDLRRILVASAGEEEVAELDDRAADTVFADLGVDSLAFMESVAAIEREFGVELSEEAVAETRTPRELLDLVNSVSANAS